MSNDPNNINSLFPPTLANALNPKNVKGLWYSDKTITLDGYTFEECRFDKCQLHVANAAHVNLINCYISDDSYFIFGHSALSAIKLFNSKTEWYYTNSPSYVPEKDDKGRITLSNNYLSGLAGFLNT